MYKISVFRIQREILCCSIDFVSLVYLCKSNKLSTQIERVNHIAPSFHQIERFNQTLIRKSTSIHHLIKLRVIHIQQLDSAISIPFLCSFLLIHSYHKPHLICFTFDSGLQPSSYSYRPHDHLFGRSIKLPSSILPTLIPSLQHQGTSQ